jgi:uncharacterized protein
MSASTATHRIDSLEALRQLYPMAHDFVINKERQTLDAATQQFIERSPFMLIGTYGANGDADVSPRGGSSGFVRVLDDTHLAIADLPGNNRLDTLENIIATGQIGLLFIMPGQGETVRINGRAHLSADPEILAGFTGLRRAPRCAIVVDVATTYVQCAKAIHRGKLWDPESWAELADVPDGAAILNCQAVIDIDVVTARAIFAKEYEAELKAEQGLAE